MRRRPARAQRPSGPGPYVESLLLEAIERRGDVRIVQSAELRVERGAKPVAVGQKLVGEAVRQRNALHGRGEPVAQLGVEGLAARAQEARAAGKAAAAIESDERRHAAPTREEFRGRRADRRVLDGDGRRAARGHVDRRGAMVRDRVMKRPHQRSAVHHGGCFGQVLANPNARRRRVDWLEIAAIILGGFGLQVPDVDGRRAAAEPHQDDCIGSRRGLLARGLGPEERGKTQTERTGGADLQEPATIRLHGSSLTHSTRR